MVVQVWGNIMVVQQVWWWRCDGGAGVGEHYGGAAGLVVEV